MQPLKLSARLVAAVSALLLLSTREMQAHCDTMNGPVVKAARTALETGDVRYALVWVKPAGEAEIRSAFSRATAIRGLAPEARSLADRYFYETLVRVHRAGEGAPYTGLKDAEEKVDPGIAAAEHALEGNSSRELAGDLTSALTERLESAFNSVQSRRTYDPQDLVAGRRYVEAYVNYIHFVERLYGSIGGSEPADESATGSHVH